jgi:hypothetical protein
VFGYLDSNNGAILALYRGLQSTFPIRKGLIGVWYYNLRSPLNVTSLGHPRDIEGRLQYKER